MRVGAHNGASVEILRMASEASGLTNRQVQERFAWSARHAAATLGYLAKVGKLRPVKHPGGRTRYFSELAHAEAWSRTPPREETPPPAPPVSELLRDTVDGTEKHCKKCDEWWPADGEFWYPDKKGVGGLMFCCKACYFELYRSSRGRG